MGLTYAWRGAFTDDELNALHAEGFEHRLLEDGWVDQVERWSLGWVTGNEPGRGRPAIAVEEPWTDTTYRWTDS